MSAPEDGCVGRVTITIVTARACGTVVDERSADRDAALSVALACFRERGRQSELVEVGEARAAGSRWRHRAMVMACDASRVQERNESTRLLIPYSLSARTGISCVFSNRSETAHRNELAVQRDTCESGYLQYGTSKI